MKVTPLGDRVLLKRHEPETQTESGIYLPETAADKPQEADVVAVGEGKLHERSGRRIEPTVKKGNTVLLNKWGGTEVTLDGEEMVIVNESDILGVLD